MIWICHHVNFCMLTKFKNDNTLLFYNAAVVLEAYDIQLNFWKSWHGICEALCILKYLKKFREFTKHETI